MKDIIFKTLMLKGEAGSTIVSMERTGHSGTTDTYTITFDDGSTTDIQIENLSSVESIELTSQTDTEDTYTATLADGSTQSFSVLNHNADIEAISEELAAGLASIAADLADQAALLSARMDEFTSLPSGSTSGDAELMDIRVGADGTTYESAGSAVRGQISDLKSELTNYPIIEALMDIEKTSSSTVAGKNNFYINKNNLALTYYDVCYVSTPYAIKKGDVIIVDIYVNTATAVVVYGDNNYGNFVKVDSSFESSSGNHEFVFVSDRDGYLYITGYKDQRETDKVTIVSHDSIMELNRRVDALYANAEKKYEDLTLEFASKTGYYNLDGTFSEYSGITGATIDVSEGENYVITMKRFYNVCVAVFFDANDNWLFSVGATGETYAIATYDITVPKNAKTMLIQQYADYFQGAKKMVGILPSNVKSVLREKNIAVIGDSITGYNFRAKTNWSMYINAWTGATVQNLGRGGTGFVKDDPYIDRISAIEGTPDIIGVAMSWNDLSAGLPIGTSSDTGTTSIAGYMNDFFDALITAYPTTPIICYCQGVWEIYRPGGTSTDGLINVLTEICSKKGVPFYKDLYYGSVLRPWISANREVYYKSDNDDIGNTGVVDNVHPNSEGHKVIARYLYPKFAENVVAVGMDYI